MGKRGFVRANREDSEAFGVRGMIARVEELDAEFGMQCTSTQIHGQHTWQMSATGWCVCPGLESTPIFDRMMIDFYF